MSASAGSGLGIVMSGGLGVGSASGEADSVTVGAVAWAGRKAVCRGCVVPHPAVRRVAARAARKMARISLIYCEKPLQFATGQPSAMLLRGEFKGQRNGTVAHNLLVTKHLMISRSGSGLFQRLFQVIHQVPGIFDAHR